MVAGSALVALAGGVSLMSASPALATCDGCVVSKLGDVNTDLDTHLDKIHDDLIDTIKKQTTQLSSYHNKQIQANTGLTDASSTNASILQKAIARALGESGRYDPAGSQCSTASSLPTTTAPASYPAFVTPAGATGSSASTSGGTSGTGSVYTGVDAVNDLRNRARGNSDPTVRSGGPAEAAAYVAQRDLYPGVLGYLDPTSDARALFDNYSIDTSNPGSNPKAQALAALNVTLTSPLPVPPLTSDQAATPEGIMELARRKTIEGRRSAAQAVLEQIEGDQIAVMPTSSLNVPSNYSRPDDGGQVSALQWLEIQVWAKYMNSDWYSTTLAQSPEAVVRETAIISAQTNFILMQMYELQRKQAALEAVRFAHELDQGQRISNPN